MAEYRYVGKSVPRVDALAKVTGRAKYCTEEGIGFPGMLYGKVLFSPHAHANIVSIDTSRAESMVGVKAVLTGKDVPGYRSGVFVLDRHILCRQKVRFVGDSVALVLADSVEAAEEAVKLIDVKYEVLPAVFDVEEAFKADCPVVVHPELPRYRRPVHPYLGKDLPGPNVNTHHKVRRGDVEQGFRQSDIIVENRYQNARITHCQLEPYNCVCYPEEDGGVTLWTSGRVWHNAASICGAFGLPPSKVRLRTVYVGGMFGVVDRPERFAVLGALKTGRPVKIVYTREECFLDGLNRLPKVIYIKDGIKKDGTLLAREMRLYVNVGPYTNIAPETIRNGSYHVSQYRIPHFKWDAYGVYSNEIPCGPLRGFGSAEVLWATEQQMDILAEKVGMDPLEFRLKHTPEEGEISVRGEVVHSIGAKEALKKVSDWMGQQEPAGPSGGSVKIGRGMALANKYTKVDTASTAMVKVHMDGTIEARHGATECGQGCNTIFTQMVAEEFAVSLDRVKLVWGDTAFTSYDFDSASSRSTMYVGNALVLACRDAKRQLFDLAAPKLGTTPDKLSIEDGRVFMKDAPQKALRISDLFLPALPEARGTVKQALCLEEGGELLGRATYWGHPGEEDPETGLGERLTLSYCYGAQAVEVAVDTETGSVKVLKCASAFDCGRPINPKLVEAQMEGGAGMGIGSSLFEGFIFDDQGKLMNPNLHDYRLPGAMEVPSGKNKASFVVEAPHREGPFGAKGMGEAAMNATAPAIANAIYNATGVRLTSIPMTPESVLKAIKGQK
ncbi:MAG: xanthine dehydrogenase family protein molybdopterin-binding subunit [Thermodesulfobacteriota bacterium]